MFLTGEKNIVQELDVIPIPDKKIIEERSIEANERRKNGHFESVAIKWSGK